MTIASISERTLISNRKPSLWKCSPGRSRENNFASLLRRGSQTRLPSGLSIIALAYNICTRVVYMHTHEKFDCTNRTIRGQCIWQPANVTNPTNLAIVRALPPYIRFLGVWALLPEESRSWNFIATGGKMGRRGQGWERIAEQAIYLNRWFIRAFKQRRSKFFAHRRSSLPWFSTISYVESRTEDLLSVLTAYSFIIRGYITADLKRALWAA